ncbi:hypothetical protein [Bradyrhizobium septentrionale]|uniref:Uncharacterized protein n=1 Tax=Bradyrhizobium septentrionale TaxID=1404411 RepID=A0ABZ2P5M0_9BRAD|nr:hypothetical protein [Bradyrhizobium septentrionale]UGY19834.1 hypothetical protein HAP48_0021640 [Bradyrhizobium septentrionale]UGY28617.1 hypothetical protein HU675_0018635 [Bradyrhizobium septentrionale]
MPPSFNLPFVLSVAGAFLTSAVVAIIYVWPALRAMPRYDALRLLAAFHAFRFLGMNFMVTGFVSPQLSADFAGQVGWGDLIAAALALLAMAALSWRWSIAIPMVWIFNVWGTLDLLNAYLYGREDRRSRPVRRRHLYSGALRAAAAGQPRHGFHDLGEGCIGNGAGWIERCDTRQLIRGTMMGFASAFALRATADKSLYLDRHPEERRQPRLEGCTARLVAVRPSRRPLRGLLRVTERKVKPAARSSSRRLFHQNGNATPVLISFRITLVRTWRMPGMRNMNSSRNLL